MYLVDYCLIECKYCLCSSFERAAVIFKITSADKLRNIFELRIESYDCGVLQFDDSFNKSVK